MHHPTDRIVHTAAFVTPVVELRFKKKHHTRYYTKHHYIGRLLVCLFYAQFYTTLHRTSFARTILRAGYYYLLKILFYFLNLLFVLLRLFYAPFYKPSHRTPFGMSVLRAILQSIK